MLPTDTVYGIGADAFRPEAVQRLLDAKVRGRDMPPPVLIGEPSLIRALATDVPEPAKELVKKHWPGALTIICKTSRACGWIWASPRAPSRCGCPTTSSPATSSGGTGPMAVSSANLSGQPAALTCDEAIDQLGDACPVYLDGGPLGGADSLPSTIVDFTVQPDEGEVLRHGALDVAVLRETCPDLEDLVPDPGAGVFEEPSNEDLVEDLSRGAGGPSRWSTVEETRTASSRSLRVRRIGGSRTPTSSGSPTPSTIPINRTSSPSSDGRA